MFGAEASVSTEGLSSPYPFKTLVCVTGATGFVATHIILQLLEKGYDVVGTCRDPNEASKVKHLVTMPGADKQLKLVKADLLDLPSLAAAVKGCDYVIHTASPYVLDVEDPQRDLVVPALDGTRNTLTACRDAGTVKRVVLTSSVAAITDAPDNKKIYTEDDWNTLSSLKRNPYYYSKTLAERAAWDFVQEFPNTFDLVVINPFLIIGPEYGGAVNTSNQLLLDMLAGNFPALFKIGWGFVDVRDVAAAHIAGMENPKAKGRYICWNETRWMKDVADFLRIKYPRHAKNIPSADLQCSIASFIIKTSLKFQNSGTAVYLRTNLGSFPQLDHSKIERELGINFRSLDESIVDTCNNLIARGKLPNLKPTEVPSSLAKLAREIRADLTIKDRKYHLKTYKQCFIGNELVDWLILNGAAEGRDDATQLGKDMAAKGLLAHVTGDHDFEDARLFYHFLVGADEQ